MEYIRCSMCDQAHADENCPYYSANATKSHQMYQTARATGFTGSVNDYHAHQRAEENVAIQEAREEAARRNQKTIGLTSSNLSGRCSMCDQPHADDDCPFYNVQETRKARAVEAAKAAGYACVLGDYTDAENALVAQSYRKCRYCAIMVSPERSHEACYYHPGRCAPDGMAMYWSCCDNSGEETLGCVHHKNHLFE